jgi:hypothetical protein
MSGWKPWISGEVLEATDFQSYIQNQVVQQYAGTAARSSALGTAVIEGMVSYLTDTNALEYYNGAAWTTVGASDPAIFTAGTAGQYFRSAGTAGVVWDTLTASDIADFTTGTTGQIVTSNGTAGITFGKANSSFITTSVGTATTAYTATTSDVNKIIYASGTAAFTVTVPDVLSIGDRIDVVRDSSGTVSIAAGTGVTSWAGAGTAGTAVSFKIDEQYNAASVLKVAANTYRVVGKITP